MKVKPVSKGNINSSFETNLHIESETKKGPLKLFLRKMRTAYRESWQYLVALKVVFIITFTVFPSAMVTSPLNFM